MSKERSNSSFLCADSRKKNSFRDEAGYKRLRMMCSRPDDPKSRIIVTRLVRLENEAEIFLASSHSHGQKAKTRTHTNTHTPPSLQNKHSLTPFHTPVFVPALLFFFFLLCLAADVAPSTSPSVAPSITPSVMARTFSIIHGVVLVAWAAVLDLIADSAGAPQSQEGHRCPPVPGSHRQLACAHP